MFPKKQRDEQTLFNCIIVGATTGALKVQAAAYDEFDTTEILVTMAAGAYVGAAIGMIIGSFQYLEDILFY